MGGTKRSLTLLQALKILGLQDRVSDVELAAAYHHQARMYHPDKLVGLAPEFQALAEKRMREINAANDLLKRAGTGPIRKPDVPSPRPSGPEAEPPDVAKAFARESAQARKLALDRGRFWEYLLTAELLRTKLDAEKREYGNYTRPSISFTGPDYLKWLGRKLQELDDLLKQIGGCLDHELPAAWGKLGEAGDPIQILNVVKGIGSFCRALLKCELEIQSADAPAKLMALGATLLRNASGIVWELSRLPHEIHHAVEEASQNGTRKYTIDLTFRLSLESFRAELENVKRHPEWLTS